MQWELWNNFRTWLCSATKQAKNEKRANIFSEKKTQHQEQLTSLYEDLRGSTRSEQDLLALAICQKSEIGQRQFVGRIKSARRRVRRLNTKIGMIENRIDVLDVFLDSHDIAQTVSDDLPTNDEISEEIVEAEQVMETVADAAADWVEGLEPRIRMSKEDEAILDEIQGKTPKPVEIPVSDKEDKKDKKNKEDEPGTLEELLAQESSYTPPMPERH